jgi:uncharacterized repeat protein (TIGR02543 family)
LNSGLTNKDVICIDMHNPNNMLYAGTDGSGVFKNDLPDLYQLTISTNSGGTTDPSPGTNSYSYGSRVTITAIPDSGYSFSGWSGCTSSTENPITITLDTHKSITANFTKDCSLTLTASTGGTTDPAPGAYAYDTGDQVTITAIPDSGYVFTGWSGDASGNANPLTITMDSNKSITANFAAQYTLTIAASAGGTTDPAPGTYTYNAREQVTITATPESGYVFSGWSGDITSADNPVTVTMDSSKSMAAHFTAQYSMTIAASTGGTTNPVPGTYTYNSGDQVAVSAAPEDGYRFSGWSGDASGTDNPLTITMDSNKSITATFIAQCTLTITAGSGGTTSPAPGTHIHDDGTSITVRATANSGYRFSNWTGDASGSSNPLTIVMNSNKSITANFTKTAEDDQGSGKKKGCFIATACYGTQMADEVQALSAFRDKYLMTNPFGREFVKFYYKHGPIAADYIEDRESLKALIRIFLIPFIQIAESLK